MPAVSWSLVLHKAGLSLRESSVMQFCALSGLLVVAHHEGELRVYQFSTAAHEVVTYEAARQGRSLRQEADSGRSVFPVPQTR